MNEEMKAARRAVAQLSPAEKRLIVDELLGETPVQGARAERQAALARAAVIRDHLAGRALGDSTAEGVEDRLR